MEPTEIPGKPVLRAWKTSHKALRVHRIIRLHGLHTVCEESLCPNLPHCWSSGTATFLILGDTCTRGCRFCYVKRGLPKPPDPGEPLRVARAAAELGLDYVVITSVTRDDLPDGGAGHYAETVRLVKKMSRALVEVLTPDFQGRLDHVDVVASAGPDVYAHNIETVERLTSLIRDPRAGYSQSLSVLARAKEHGLVTKSSILLGLGEDSWEVVDAMRDLRSVGVDILVLGQYFRPSKKQVPVAKYYRPSEFKELEKRAYGLGFKYVLAHPLARTSYKAREAYLAAVGSRG